MFTSKAFKKFGMGKNLTLTEKSIWKKGVMKLRCVKTAQIGNIDRGIIIIGRW
jgi:hypothetical protein